MNANVRGLVEYVRFSIHRPVRRFNSENQSRLFLCDRSVYTHFTKRRINLVNSNVTFSNVATGSIYKTCESPQCRAVMTVFERIGGDLWKLPILEVAKIVFNLNSVRINAHSPDEPLLSRI